MADLTVDQHLLTCTLCSSGDDACGEGRRLFAQETAEESREEHRRQLHDPSDPEAEACCAECCGGCSTDTSDGADD